MKAKFLIVLGVVAAAVCYIENRRLNKWVKDKHKAVKDEIANWHAKRRTQDDLH